MLKPELIKECRKKGLQTHGTKAQLVSILVRDTINSKDTSGATMKRSKEVRMMKEDKGQNYFNRHGQGPMVRRGRSRNRDEEVKTGPKVVQIQENREEESEKLMPMKMKKKRKEEI